MKNWAERLAGLAWVVPAAGILLAAGRVSAEPPPVLKTPKDKTNYAIGVNLISNFRQQGVDIDLDLVVQGMRDAAAGGKYLLSDEEIRIGIQRFQVEVRQKRSLAMANAAIEARLAGEAFLEKNKAAKGVITLPSGIQYRVLKAGTGKTPTGADTVEVKFRGTLVSGKQFDGTGASGKTASFKVDTAIRGWAEALKLMPAGSTWEIVVPAPLAYGPGGKPGIVGPNEVVILETELIGVK
jgi:FKBP-type peptidyl-prolyl cis-trans isomerase FklB